MRKSITRFTCACLSVVSLNVNSALVGRLAETAGGTDYQAYYDTDADITWLADTNAAGTSGLGQYGGGGMEWAEANNWAANLDVAGITGWRLPYTLQPDASCYSQNGVSSFGRGCAGSEMGNMFYNVLGNDRYGLTNSGPFANLPIRARSWYWSATEYVVNPKQSAWYFDLGGDGGSQMPNTKGGPLFSWAVHDGDVAASVVPVPSAAWLFGSGLLGLIGIARRKANA